MAPDPWSGERYLRRLLERAIDPLDPEPAETDALRIAGDALVAVGAVGAALADDLHHDLMLALVLREEVHHLLPGPSGAMRRSVNDKTMARPAARAVAIGPARFGSGAGALTVDVVTFGTDGATVHLSLEGERTFPLGSAGPFPTLPRSGGAMIRPPNRPRRAGPGGPGGSELPATTNPMPTFGARTSPLRRVTRPGGGPSRRRSVADAGLEDRLEISDDRGSPYHLGPRSDPRGGYGPMRCRLEPAPPGDLAWIEVRHGRSEPTRLPVTAPRPIVTAGRHGRRPGSWWVLGRLCHAVTRFDEGNEAGDAVSPGVRALVAVGAIAPTDPLVHQVELLEAARGAAEIDPALDARWRSPLERRHETPAIDGMWAIATAVDLGDTAARLDVLRADDAGVEILGACGPWSDGPGGGIVMSAFDDRHNWYTATTARRGDGGSDDVSAVTWHLWPAVDPEAASLRLHLTGPDTEASVEVRLR